MTDILAIVKQLAKEFVECETKFCERLPSYSKEKDGVIIVYWLTRQIHSKKRHCEAKEILEEN